MEVKEKAPIGGTDYPTTWFQFLDWFHSEQACRDYMEKLRFFYRLLQQAVITGPVTYDSIAGRNIKHSN